MHSAYTSNVNFWQPYVIPLLHNPGKGLSHFMLRILAILLEYAGRDGAVSGSGRQQIERP
jgi:hypothetical protein